MKEHVSELTPEEFQKTFPITLEDVRPEYSSWYEEERAAIVAMVQILDDISAGRLERMPNGQPNGYSNAKYKYVDELSKKAKSAYPGRYKIS